MTNYLQRISPRKLFFLDSIGALLTAFLLGIVLAELESIFGVPQEQLYFLAIIALVLAIYSLTCALKANRYWKPLMQGIAIGNMLYVILTIVMVFQLRDRLTAWGFLYFVAEATIILLLAAAEMKKAGSAEQDSA